MSGTVTELEEKLIFECVPSHCKVGSTVNSLRPNILTYILYLTTHSISDLLDVLESNNIQHTTIIQDLQKMIDLSEMSSVRTRISANHSMDWTSYHPIEDMYSYLDYLESTFDFVTTESIGKSYEGTEMRLAKVCKGGCGNKPAMWIDGGLT